LYVWYWGFLCSSALVFNRPGKTQKVIQYKFKIFSCTSLFLAFKKEIAGKMKKFTQINYFLLHKHCFQVCVFFPCNISEPYNNPFCDKSNPSREKEKERKKREREMH
jgi:hypothetical protein